MIRKLTTRYFSIERFGSGDPRWWVRLGKPRYDPVEQYHHYPIRLVVEFSGFGPRASLNYSRGEDHTLALGLGWTAYVSWDNRGRDYPGYEWGFRWHGDYLSLTWRCDDSEMHYSGGGRGKPKRGWKWVGFPMDILFGRRDYHRVETGHQVVSFAMPEGRYQADCTLTRCTWTRPRWPWWPLSLTLDRAEIDFDPPVGIPGKGENSWDCDDDATHAMTTPLKHGSLRATIEEFALDTLRTRMHRGGLDWKPVKGWPEVVSGDEVRRAARERRATAE